MMTAGAPASTSSPDGYGDLDDAARHGSAQASVATAGSPGSQRRIQGGFGCGLHLQLDALASDRSLGGSSSGREDDALLVPVDLADQRASVTGLDPRGLDTVDRDPAVGEDLDLVRTVSNVHDEALGRGHEGRLSDG